jgi:hypothetical protein
MWLWLIWDNAFATKENIVRRKWVGNTKFQFFNEEETVSSLIARTPLPFVDRNNHLSKQFLSLFYK